MTPKHRVDAAFPTIERTVINAPLVTKAAARQDTPRIDVAKKIVVFLPKLSCSFVAKVPGISANAKSMKDKKKLLVKFTEFSWIP